MPDHPLYRTASRHVTTSGDIAAQVGSDLRLPPDPEQRWQLDEIYGSDDTARQPPEVCVVAPRQNLKTAVYEVAALTDLFVHRVRFAVWTAHEFKTARKTFEDMRWRIRANPDYDAVTTFRDSHGEEAIVLDSGERLEFHARSSGSGRGFTCSRITLDEAGFLRSSDLAALSPTTVTLPDAQLRYAASAGMLNSAVLRGIRDRGRAGLGRLVYVEYGAPVTPCEPADCTHIVGAVGCALDRVDLWRQANPAMWSGRISEEALRQQREALPPADFAREFLSWWTDPVDASKTALNIDHWRALADPNAPRGARVSFGADVAEDRIGSIAVAWRTKAGVHVMLSDPALPMSRMAPRLRDLCQRWHGAVVVGGPASTLADEITAQVMTGGEFAAACGDVADAVRDRTISHGGQPELDRAVEVAVWRPVGTAGERAFQLRAVPGIGPLAAAARAVYGVLHREVTPPAAPMAVEIASETADLATMPF